MVSSKDRSRSKQQPNEGAVDLSHHPLVERLYQQGEGEADQVALVGFLGPSKKANFIRLYLSLSFDRFIEIPVGDIVLTQAVDAQDENSPSRLFVRRDAKLDLVYTETQTVEARYLRGRISTDYLTGSSSSSGLNGNLAYGGRAGVENAFAGNTFELGCYTLAGSLCLTCTKTFICPPEVL
ncbi:hypothetical protein [Rhizobium sp. P28RR-XV]|uniref:hypothetical protein n=1 Tax=Rhizobium sp. P28RR-XV TaxID=2726737 RepID=UPI001456E3A0|nr:hypothetical protein [Rhizobium sp. P28RR-XV]NLR88818.1 hypothetical protein [Rhizobium sp. P28RR-XV]